MIEYQHAGLTVRVETLREFANGIKTVQAIGYETVGSVIKIKAVVSGGIYPGRENGKSFRRMLQQYDLFPKQGA